jgi:DNA-binding CsgD family transcriptional regulator
MLSIIGDEVSPILTGTLFCAVLLECRAMLDVRRAHEWSEALNDWCEKQQELFPYRGECLIHRSELMQLHGHWQDASDEAARAIDQLAEPPRSPLGAACYQKAEIHRVRGDFAEAEEAYASAARVGLDPHPGLALLWFAQGRLDAAESAIRRMRDARGPWTPRPSILSAFVEIVLAAGDVDAARDASNELTSFAESMNVPYARALADGTAASVALADGDARAALDAARRALAVWTELGAPYEAARARLLIGRACAALGDDESAKIELATARETFEELGAAPDLARSETLSGSKSTGLTPREHVIIRLVAAGKTNKAIANELLISEKTVERHLSNIFTKLGVQSRAAATAYAYENHLV